MRQQSHLCNSTLVCSCFHAQRIPASTLPPFPHPSCGAQVLHWHAFPCPLSLASEPCCPGPPLGLSTCILRVLPPSGPVGVELCWVMAPGACATPEAACYGGRCQASIFSSSNKWWVMMAAYTNDIAGACMP